MTVIDLQEYMKNKKSIVHAPIAKNKEIFRSALCFELETLLRQGGFSNIRVMYHESIYIFILNISLWMFFKIQLMKWLRIFSWKDSMFAAIKKIDPDATELKMFRSWPHAKSIYKIINS